MVGVVRRRAAVGGLGLRLAGVSAVAAASSCALCSTALEVPVQLLDQTF